MIVDTNTLLESVDETFEYCILGGGVAGITLATELLKSEKDICIIEGGDETFTMDSQSLYEPAAAPLNYEDPTYDRLRFLGGSSNHWENNTSPLNATDFEEKEWVKNSGWPISYEQIEPYYLKAAEYCGTGSDGYKTQYWADKFQQTDPMQNSSKITTNIVKGATPPTRFFNKYGDMLKTQKNVTVFKNANLVDIEFDQTSEEIKQITFSNFNKVLHTINAKVFILCLGGIENARYMLIFNQKYQNALGNKGDNVGRYFMDHPVLRAAKLYPNDKDKFSIYTMRKHIDTKMVSGFIEVDESAIRKHKINNVRIPLFERNNFIISEGIESFHVLSSALDNDHLPDYFGQHLINILSDIDMVSEAIARKTFDSKLFDHADDFGGYDLPIMIEQTPHRDNRVYLGEAVDKLGIQKILIDWQLHQDDIENMWKALELIGAELGKLGLGRLKVMKEYEERLVSEKMYFSHHHMGTTRMADNVDKGVVDANLKVFGTKNLYISGSSVFPTGSHLPPTLTIAALTVRLAEHLTDHTKELS